MADNESFDLLDGLRLAFDAEGRHLVAHLQPPENSDPLKLAWLETKLRELGLDQLALDPRAINQLLQHFNAGETPEPLVIGERLDGEFSLRVSKDGMTAHLSLTPAKGGRPVDLQAIHDRLAEQGIVHGVMNPAIEAAVNAGEASDQLIAQGTPPVHGADARIESCLPQTGHAAPIVDDKGVVDYQAACKLLTVSAGAPLLRRVPPTPGQPGATVRGQRLDARKGKDQAFATKLSGAGISPDDPNLVIATISGQPVVVGNGVSVNSSITVKEVDLAQGSIDFEGTVMISGDVHTGMTVRATGDVLIGGTVCEAATVESGGNITVQKGVIGRGAIDENGKASGDGIAKVSCAGDLTARFIENARVRVGGNAVIGELISHAEVTAATLKVGQEKAKRGHIMGGRAMVGQRLEAEVLGSPAGVATTITVGVDSEAQAALEQAQEMLASKESEHVGLAKAWARLTPEQAALRDRIAATQQQLQTQIAALRAEVARGEEQLAALAEEARIAVNRRVFHNVQIQICHQQQRTREENGFGSFRLKDGELIYDRH